MLDQRGTRAENAMMDEGDRRLFTWYGFVLICLSVFMALLSFSRGYDRWHMIILAGASLAIGAGMLAFAFRRYRRD